MNKTSKPKGEEAVRKALLQAALDAYVGSEGFSVRKIAERAGVNHGQVHHYFGGMKGLKKEMLAFLAASLDEQLQAEGQLDLPDLMKAAARVTLKDRRFVRALARRILEEPGDLDFQLRFPVVSRLRSAIPEEWRQQGDILLAEGVARGLGWTLFRPWITQALNLSEESCAQIDKRLGESPVIGGL